MSHRPTAGKEKVVATNRKAYHDYHIDEKYEAGLVLVGSEIKSIRAGRVNLRDGYAQFKGNELWLLNTHIATYQQAGRDNHEPRRPRKLLLHRRQLSRLQGKVQERGYTIVPLRLYFKGNRAKVELALVRGKRLYDKRRAIAEREFDREIQRAYKDAAIGRDVR